jgi:hypothetical protein
MINLGKASSKTDGKLIKFGPVDSDGNQLSLPEMTTRLIEYPALGFRAEYTFVFDGNRLKLDSMSLIEATKPEKITTYALTKLRIPEVMRDLVYSYNHFLGAKLDTLSLKDTTTLAQYYYAEFACDGSPRKVLMSYMNWSRSNANYHLKKFANAGLIPAERLRYTESS